MYRMPHKCPVCDGKLTVTRVSCPTCGTTMEGEFTGCRFCELSPEESQFLLVFIKNRGSIKDVERELGMSYPTVRAALDGLIASLGLNQTPARVLPTGEGSDTRTADPSDGDIHGNINGDIAEGATVSGDNRGDVVGSVLGVVMGKIHGKVYGNREENAGVPVEMAPFRAKVSKKG